MYWLLVIEFVLVIEFSKHATSQARLAFGKILKKYIHFKSILLKITLVVCIATSVHLYWSAFAVVTFWSFYIQVQESDYFITSSSVVVLETIRMYFNLLASINLQKMLNRKHLGSRNQNSLNGKTKHSQAR